MTHCHELSEYSVKTTPKYFQVFPEINDVISSVYENQTNKSNCLPFQHAQ